MRESMKPLGQKRLATSYGILLLLVYADFSLGNTRTSRSPNNEIWIHNVSTVTAAGYTPVYIHPPAKTEEPSYFDDYIDIQVKESGTNKLVRRQYGPTPYDPKEFAYYENKAPTVYRKWRFQYDILHKSPGNPEDYKMALLSWGPAFLVALWFDSQHCGPFNHRGTYQRLYRGNSSTIFEPDWVRHYGAGMYVLIQRRLYSYPGIPCPYWLEKNSFCHLLGESMHTYPWQKFSDWILRDTNVGATYRVTRISSENYAETNWENYRVMQPNDGYRNLVFKEYPIRIFPCDPTKDCPALPTLETTGFPFIWETTTRHKTTVPNITRKKASRIPPLTTKPTEADTESWREKNDLRWVAKMLWPLFFVLCLFWTFFMLPCLYITGKRKAEKEATERWMKATSPDGRVNFLVQIPPRWPPGWPPGPREPADSRTFKEPNEGVAEEAGEAGEGPPPAKRPRS